MRRLRASRTRRVLRKILPTVLVGLVVVGVMTVGNPALAQEPPDLQDSGTASTDKADSKISSLLRNALNELRSTDRVGGTVREAVTRSTETAEGGSAPAAKELAVDGEDGARAGADGPATGTGDDLVRFDGAGNVQVYIFLTSNDEAALQRVRRAVTRVEIENLDAKIIQAWVRVEHVEALAALDGVRRVAVPGLWGHQGRTRCH